MTSKSLNLRNKKLWTLLLLAVLLFYPFETTVVTRQKVLVVTEDWRPIEGAPVRQIWQNYSIESEGHQEDLRTDENGRVTFPRRRIRASVLRRLLHPLWNILRQGTHASFGVHTDMFPLGEVTEKTSGQKTVEAQPGEIVFRLRKKAGTTNASSVSSPRNLKEQLAMEETMSNPATGNPVPLKGGMTDPRWPASDGWVKMRRT